MRIKLGIVLICCCFFAAGQGVLKIKAVNQDDVPLIGCQAILPDLQIGGVSTSNGEVIITGIPNGQHRLIVSFVAHQRLDTVVSIASDTLRLKATLAEGSIFIPTVDVNGDFEEGKIYSRLKDIEGVAIYAAKKNEIIDLQRITANTSANNARQIFARVPGVNVWESDDAGLQLGVGARGLSPDRTANFNTRQNGYDMAADALGYPESYYAPPMQAIDRIEIVRGAASLQYGTQFGGMINLKLKRGNTQKKWSGQTMNTYNSLGYFNTFNELGGQSRKLNYYGFLNYRTGSGFRENTNFDAGTGHLRLAYDISKKLVLAVEYTRMNYAAQQAGGLTDVQFQNDPYQSLRERNWFKVDWNLMALNLDYKLSKKTVINTRTFGLISSRQALGYLRSPNRIDGLTDPNDPTSYENRDLIVDHYRNIGNETRLLHRYTINSLPMAFLGGFRLYKGFTEKAQGFGNNGTGPDFNFDSTEKLKSDYEFPSTNLAVFIENIFNINDRLSFTPGLRFENIKTTANGFYDSSVRLPLTGEIIIDSSTFENRSRERNLLLAGLGIGYRLSKGLELYANFSQNYRAITFNDIRVVNPSAAVDPDLQDEKGFNFDIGLRGTVKSIFTIDAGLFWLSYTDKIGSVQTTYIDNFFGERIVRLTTNVADAEILGAETYLETNLVNLLGKKSKQYGLSHFINLAYTHAEYHNSRETAVEGKRVEAVPTWNIKTGLQGHYKAFMFSFQYTYLSEQYSEATNAESSPTGVYGLIPSYWLLDLSLTYSYKILRIEGGVNNLTNNTYFTRRAVGYPGPGIIPSAPISFYVGLGVAF